MQKNNKCQEAQSFIGRKGAEYVSFSATDDEKQHFEGTIYNNGIPNLSLISYLTSPISILDD